MSRLLIQTMVMTGSDLCASAKPWEQQIKTVAVIYEEFYIQVRGGKWEMMVLMVLMVWYEGRLREAGGQTASAHHEQISGGRTGSASGNKI